MSARDRRLLFTGLGYLAGLCLACAVFAASDHLLHRQDSLGVACELLLIFSLGAFGALFGRLCDARH